MTRKWRHALPLPGSERHALPGAVEVGLCDPAERVTVTVYVRQRGGPIDIQELGLTPPRKRRYLTYRQMVARYGAARADLERVEQFAKASGLRVGEVSTERRSVQLSGSAGAMEQAFGVTLKRYRHGKRTFRGRTGPIHVPQALEGIVEAVFGLDNRKMAHSYVRRGAQAQSLRLAHTALPAGTFLPPQVAALYNFPARAGTGQTIGILTFNDDGGGYRTEALRTYFRKVLHQPAPAIAKIVVAGPGNKPSRSRDPRNATDEVMLDLQIVGALAPGAKIRMYFSTFTEQGWVDALARVTMDRAPVDVLSISYGNPENARGSAWTRAAIEQVAKSLEAAAARGITVCCASGDSGSSGGATGVHADYPASDPSVLAVGGTRLVAAGNAIRSETVWHDREGAGGGGVSAIFPAPPWQHGIQALARSGRGKGGRGVPDVSGVADPQTGFNIIDVAGRKLFAMGGTSATAPLWAALVARLNQALGVKLGFFTPLLYGKLFRHLNDVTKGRNGRFAAGPGWDPCTGWGTPDGAKLLEAFEALG